MLIAAMKSKLEQMYRKDDGLSDTYMEKISDNEYWLKEDDPIFDDKVKIKLGDNGPQAYIDGDWIDLDEAGILDLVDEF